MLWTFVCECNGSQNLGNQFLFVMSVQDLVTLKMKKKLLEEKLLSSNDKMERLSGILKKKVRHSGGTLCLVSRMFAN